MYRNTKILVNIVEKGKIKMSVTTLNQEIKNTSDVVREFGFRQKKELLSREEIIDQFLDSIPKLKKILSDRADTLEEVVDKIDHLTTLGKPSEPALIKINDLISLLRDWHSVLIRDYVSLNSTRKLKIAKEEIKLYKSAIDDLKEGYEDLESIYFFLPSMPEFEETTLAISMT